ncbi:MAG: CBS domain-containing protein [Pacificimonas sp.]
MKISERREFAQKSKPLSCDRETTVFDAVKRMSAMNFGSIIVTDPDERVVGMMTERDIFRRLIAEELDPKATKVEEIMTSPVRKAKADDNLLEWLRMMSNERFRRLPVVDDDDKLIAVMSQGDFVSYTWPELFGRVGEMARASLPERVNPIFIFVSILIYTLILIFAVAQFT